MVPARFRLSARLGAGLSVLALLGGPVGALAQAIPAGPAGPASAPVPPLAVPVPVPPAAAPEPSKISEPKPLDSSKTSESRPIEAKSSEAKPPEAPKKSREPAPLVYAKVSTDPTPTLTARTFLDTLKVADRYAAFAEAGGWERLPDDLIRLKPGERSPAIPSLRHHLTLTGDLPADAPPSDRLDPPLVSAIAAFQGRHGLPDSGILGRLTINALNVPAATRQRQLAASASRLIGSKFPFGERYVVVNIPSANVEAVENGAVARRYVAVVGSPDKATPTVETRITDINFNPTWTVPASVVKNEIIPQMRKNPGYLARNHIRILGPTGEVDPTKINWAGDKAVNYTLRQDSGFDNSLGQVRIDMPNRFAVYMHDTPAKSLFSAAVRFHSHGCVRVGQVKELVGWLLQGTDGPNGPGTSWGPIEIETGIADGERRDIKLVKPVPVTFVYLTGYATPDGRAHFRDDIYNLDTPAPAPEPAATGAIQPAGAAQPVATPKPAAVKPAAPKAAVAKPAAAKAAASKVTAVKPATEGLNPETPQPSR
ncbi:L,D-transpeptidase family protein [Methylobacterium pseudosasicola]|uniref:Putative peptidoglycan binding domain-containing protein n=1 Tax=Methylobacterium pseudosasicola TaxID=582667 RepID=A0A1I4G7J6_9HYPH|nr:L,D-transpeptidase family protein [Methylobacterium pseudosasicola]SFL25267.1 Putative peptidoglycan binding domain-containing protein [Methylobacterium pseudosasicola]